MHQQKTVIHRILKSFLFVPVVFVFLLTANAQSAVNNSTNSIDSIQQQDKDYVYDVVDKVAVYPGGEKALLNYVGRNTKYPFQEQQNGVQGTVMVRFVVTKLGKVEKAAILRSVSPNIDEEALRVVNLLQDWIPAEKKGEKVSMNYVLPIQFKLNGGLTSKSIDRTKKVAVILDEKLLPNDFDLNTLNKDSIKSVLIAKPDQKEKLEELASKYGANTTNGVIIVLTKAYARLHPSPKVEPIDDDKVYVVIDQMPQFRGGEPALLSFISHNLKYPVEAQRKGIQGTVIVRFVVSKTGHVDKVEVLRSLYSALDAESVRVVQSLPDWIPGEQRGEKVNVYYTLPIRFKLQ
ncbi:MAG TPA: TonB family protein [Paludibacter sp.]